MKALILGEALIDQYPDRSVVAGAPLHVAAHLARLGWDASLVTRVGRDPDGDVLVRAAERFGIDTAHIERDPELPTGRTLIGLDDAGNHSFDVLAPAAWDAVQGPTPVPGHDVICFGTLGLRSPGARRELRRVITLSAGFKAVDLNLRYPHVAPGIIEYAVTEADLLKVNESELIEAADALAVEPTPRALTERGPEWVAVTRGAAGARLSRRGGGDWEVAGIPLEVVDTVGAGDAFLAGLIHGLFGGEDPEGALSAANSLAAQTVGRRGGMP